MSRSVRAFLITAAAGVALLLVALLFSCRRQPKAPAPAPDSAVRLERSVPFPIVLLHGMGSTGQTWGRLAGDLRGAGLRYGGLVRLGLRDMPEVVQSEVLPEKADFFILEIRNPYQSLGAWTADLEKLLAEVHRRTRGARVILVGHSAGGVAGRHYLVEHPRDHHLAKLVTVASPNRGSNLAMVPHLLLRLRARISGATGGENGLATGVTDGLLREIESYMDVPLRSPILPDLLPESLNQGLAALNEKAHPEGVEYECLRAQGGVAFDLWPTIGKVLSGEIPLSQVTSSQGHQILEYFQGGHAFQGDGAVSVESQDLGKVAFFRKHPELISECRGVPVDHSGIKNETHEILHGITSPVRILAVRRMGDESRRTLVVEFHDYFAGLAKVTARDSSTYTSLPAGAPVVFQRGDQAFGRVEIGPFDERKTGALDLLVTSLDGRRYGQTLLLRSSAQPPSHEEPQPVVLRVWRVEGISAGSLLSWVNVPGMDDRGPQSDLQVVLTVDGDVKLRTPVRQDVGDSADLEEEARFTEDPDEAWIALELLDIDPGDRPDQMGQILWRPGTLPRGSVAAKTVTDLTVRLEVDRPPERRILWAKDPVLLFL